MSEFGLYLHIPFCAKRCDYCAFATWTDRHHLTERYLRACATHLSRSDLPPVTSVFVGGGTPSLVHPHALGAVLDRVPLAAGAEVTVECNPDDVTPALLGAYVEHRVTRVSIGVQSLVPHVLAGLGRTHDPAAVARAVDALHGSSLTTFNLDLIYGQPTESMADWETTLRGIVAFDPPHVSAYGLTVEAGTPLAARRDGHPDDDDQADKYVLVDEVLSASGRPWYEVSNWARPGHECVHNRLYWTMGEYAAVGCAAHGHRAGRRYWNLRTPERYCAAVEAGDEPEAGSETLDADDRLLEGLQLALRTRRGVPATALDLGDPSLDELVESVGDRVVLTRAGRLLANEVALRLIGEAADAPARQQH